MKWLHIRRLTKKEYNLMLKPWITNLILRNCIKRDSILRSISQEKDLGKLISLQNNYKKLRNEITKGKHSSKKTYYTSYFEKTNKSKSADIWKVMRSLINLKSTKSTSVKLLDKNNLLSDPKILSNMFNDHFSTIASGRT